MPFGVLVAKDFHIIWLSNILALSLRDEDYSKSVSCALILIFPFFFSFFLLLYINMAKCNWITENPIHHL